MKAPLTKTAVDNLRRQAQAAGRTIYCWDTEVTGFGVYATRTGACSYFVEYRMGGRSTPSKRMNVGKHGILTPREAREKAKRELGKVADGVDVAQVKKEERYKLAAETFKDVAEAFLDQQSKPTRYWHEMRQVLNRDAYEAFGSKPIVTITKQQIRATLDEMARRAPTAERKLYAALSPLFKWAVERGTPETNPMVGISRPTPVQKRKRVLDAGEIAILWNSIAILDRFEPFYQLLILTGQRLEEVAGIRWEEIDFQRAIWRLPPAEEYKAPPSKNGVQQKRTKNSLEHIVDLSPQAIAIIDALPGARQGLIFTTTGVTRISGFSKLKRRVDAEMKRKLGQSFRAWRNHDLRRTMSTHMRDFLGVERDVVELILNHSPAGLVGTYQLPEHREKRKAAMIAWGAYVERLAKGADCAR